MTLLILSAAFFNIKKERGIGMKKLRYVQVERENEAHYALLESLVLPYFEELDMHEERITSKEFVLKFTKGIQNMQGPYDRHLELCYCDDVLLGFWYGKVDHEGHKGFIKPEYGYIMEFYIKPEYRRKGYGRAMVDRLEELFASHGVKRMYLTSDPITGKPFWECLGFVNTNEKSPENNLDIYEKEVIGGFYRCAAVYTAKNILIYKNGVYDKAEISPKINGQILVGDYLRCDSLYGQGYTDEIIKRKNVVKRLVAGKYQGLAANVDVIFVVTSANQDFNMARLERYYIVAKESSARICFILSKIDLIEEYEVLVNELRERFRDCEILKTSMYSQRDKNTLFDYWKPGETAVFLGSSGVGKSTLINALLGNDVIATQAIRESTGRGRHTTTARHMYVISEPEERYVIDTPGLRSVGISANSNTIDELFPEIKELEKMCKYNDCSHLKEPGCAIQAALVNEELDYERYLRYLKLSGQEKKREIFRFGKAYQKEKLTKELKHTSRRGMK